LTVALKFLSTSLSVTDEARQRFMREAMSASALDSSNIGAVHLVRDSQFQAMVGAQSKGARPSTP
jgi:hypothetical protein